jgi:hypothetical protein
MIKKIITMKKFFTALVLTLVCVSVLSTTTCLAGNVLKETRETGTFRKISTGGGIDVYFTQNDAYSVVVEADEDLIGNLSTAVDDENLVIKWKENPLSKNRVAKVHVSAPALDAVNSSGGADFYADNLKCDGSFQLNISGGADADIKNLTVAKNIDISSSGGAEVRVGIAVGGDTHAATITASGGADCSIESLQTAKCMLSASGGADMDVNVTVSKNLNVAASGGGDIKISGKVNDVNISASGGGDVNIKKLTYTTINIHTSSGGDVSK